MHYGIYTPNFGAETTPRLLADLAAEAEETGWDGAFPLNAGGPITPPSDTLRDIRSYIEEHRQNQVPFDLVIMGTTPENDPKAARKKVARYAGTGLTWWLESVYRWRNSIEGIRQRIRLGPPRIDL